MNRKEFIKKGGLALTGVSLLANKQLFGANTTAATKSEEEAWNGLLEAKYVNNPSYKYIKNDPDLRNVFIYGDSISVDYTPYVREELSAIANVYRLHCNGRDSKSFIANMEVMLKTMKPYWDFSFDAIHFNVGLHDLKYMNRGEMDVENGTIKNELPEYKREIRSIINWLRENFPHSKLIFATTTPVPENSKGRIKGDAVKYNDAALSVLEEYPDIRINDLYSYVLPNHTTWMKKKGNVHYNETGKKHQGIKVAEEILKGLAMP